jgi:hypothetical protein
MFCAEAQHAKTSEYYTVAVCQQMPEFSHGLRVAIRPPENADYNTTFGHTILLRAHVYCNRCMLVFTALHCASSLLTVLSCCALGGFFA